MPNDKPVGFYKKDGKTRPRMAGGGKKKGTGVQTGDTTVTHVRHKCQTCGKMQNPDGTWPD